MTTSAGVVTVGSINIDLIVRATRRPLAGETFTGESFAIFPGGKGANQAVQTALSGARSFMVARLGSDVFAPIFYQLFAEAGVDAQYVVEDEVGTGVGHVVVDTHGDYSTIIVARANGNLSPQDIDKATSAFAGSQILLLQLEVPLPTVTYAAQKARQMGLTVFLNAAPALPLPPELLDCVDVLIVNEIEAQMLAEGTLAPSTPTIDLWLRQLSAGLRDVVITLGSQGAVAMDRHGQQYQVGGHAVEVVNTIGAGDAFVGELAARVSEGMTLAEALPYANAAGAVAVTLASPQVTRADRHRLAALLG
ncbi:MAG: ribokinase [Anaerolineae bacterium]